ncbi:MAG TPA: DUF2975 domain-containing protein [Caulobacteraceae bacterium]|jgi:hypothetical protein
MGQAAVIDFATEARQPDPPPSLRRMRLVSGGLEILFLVLALGFGLLALPLLLDFVFPYAGDAISLGPKGGLVRLLVPWGHPHPHPLPTGYIPPEAMPVIQRLAQVPVGLLHAVPMVLLFWNLRRLFGLYARGVVFAPDNARCLKHVGAALIAIAVAPWLGHALLDSLHLAIDKSWMHASSLEELVLGAIVYVIAQVMQLGHEIEQDRSQFV